MSPRISLEPIWRHLETQIFDTWHVSPRALGLFRIYYCALALGVLVPFTNSLWTRAYPRAAIAPPPGLMALMPEALWAPGVVLALHVVLVASFALIGIGWRTPLASWVAGISWILVMGIGFSFGKIDHTLMVALVPLLLGRYWGEELSLDARRRRAPPRPMPAWLLAYGAWVLSLMMLTAAIPKLMSGWLDPTTAVVDSILERQVLVHERTAFFASAVRELPWNPGLELLDWGAVLLEGAFVFALLSPRRFRFLLAVALTFHLAILLTMNIAFETTVAVYGLFAPLSWLAERLERAPIFVRVSRWLARRSSASIAAAALLVAAPLSLLLMAVSLRTRGIRWLSLPLPDWPASLVVMAGGLVGALVLLGRFRDALRQLRRHPGILIYDPDCAFCTRCAEWAARGMRSSEVRAWRDVPALLAAHGLSPDDCTAASWWVDDQGRRLRGERAIAKCLIDMGGLRSVAGWLIFVPILSWLSAVAYRLIAENRHLMPGGTAACALPAPPAPTLTTEL